MAPSSGHIIVPKLLKVVRLAIARTNEAIRSKLATTEAGARVLAEPAPVYARVRPANAAERLKQARSQSQQLRWYNQQTRTFISSTTKPKDGHRVERSRFQNLRVGRTIQQAGVSPFASALRPNLTGGTLPRSAGGYTLGGAGKARHFSHTSGCQAQVVHNVGNGIRAFVVGGGKVRYDGVDPTTGEKRFKKVTATQEQAYKRFDRSHALSRGTNVEFKISPTVTALSPLFSQQGSEAAATAAMTLQSPELLATLSGDFARSLRTLSQILGDLQRLSNFGELPISLKETTPDGPVLVVRFPGCDADIVGRLCDEVGVTRGVIREDSAWQDDKEVEMALLFPFAPNDPLDDVSSEIDALDYFEDLPLDQELQQEKLRWRNHDDDLSSHQSFVESTLKSPGLHEYSPSGYESLEEIDTWSPAARSPWKAKGSVVSGVSDFEGVEGIYKFIQLCDGRGQQAA